ncbi:enoyl-CoA hydratase-related protein [Sphingobium sp. HBC34]|uniref:Enoyl-CoA hydratase-related protein n=1 Tax=Sphingobium cyanobacteriorum TaxID=3063954 RepID=A0ABT8ZM47_9SPHN|nr:enoyl-CoA hydratase-related protein [Sphingobium sp. HBC34]MDO7835458.1 enoyl-CoA hydratase-related protein [Sphingobium sp. HBC34]
MTGESLDRIPVIIAIGEFLEQPADPAEAREPVDLMAQALRAAELDAGVPLLPSINSIELVGQVSWRYSDPVNLLCHRLGIKPARAINASMGGETPIRLIHQAALRIAKGESQVAAVVGGEAVSALNKARKAKVKLDWPPLASREDTVKLDFEKLPLSRSAKKAAATDPVHIYPLYENALQAAKGQTPAQGTAESAALWARYAAVAADNPYAWIRTAPSAEDIGTPSESNRMVSHPYPKLMVANPNVNQAGTVIVASLAWARTAGIADDKIVYIHGGAAAHEPGDYLLRDGYDHSTAQQAVLERAVEVAGGDAGVFDLAELYSCFPVVPKMAMATLGLREDVEPTVAGGLTFFGGPLNNYMTHGVCAMVRRLRSGEGKVGLVYGQGGVVSKHHALVLASFPATTPLDEEYSVQDKADALRGPVPELIDDYAGPAEIETFTVLYGPTGHVRHGVVIARNPDGARLIARVRADDEISLALLTSTEQSPVGAKGYARIDAFGNLVWEAGALRDRRAVPKKFCTVERDGKITIVTINRPDSMNSLHPFANEELSEVFDEFQADPDQWVAILTGAGDRAFSSGNDLKFTATAMARGDQAPMPTKGFAGLTSRWDLSKPVIAAVNGVAMGGGFEIALACDLIIASRNAVFALPEPKVGLAALAGGLLRLPRQIGLKQAMGMILTGRRVSAEEGLSLGFVNEVVEPDDLIAAARRWAEEISACSPMSVRASKEAVLRGLEEDLQSASMSQTRYPAMGALFRSNDIKEGPLAFAQKRAPQWKGH